MKASLTQEQHEDQDDNSDDDSDDNSEDNSDDDEIMITQEQHEDKGGGRERPETARARDPEQGAKYSKKIRRKRLEHKRDGKKSYFRLFSINKILSPGPGHLDHSRRCSPGGSVESDLAILIQIAFLLRFDRQNLKQIAPERKHFKYFK